MAKYFLTNRAVEDLSEIWEYTYKTWSESQADKYYELLIGFCKEISKNPDVGKSYDAIEKNIFGYRVSQHIIFYRVIKPNEIEVLRFLHVRMDLKNRIQE
jgi:toxin ParE1/3/4